MKLNSIEADLEQNLYLILVLEAFIVKTFNVLLKLKICQYKKIKWAY